MAGDEAILIVGLMACVFSAVLSAGFSYTCTGGSFDPDDFDTDKCLTLFPEDDDEGGGGGGGGGNDDPADFPASNVSACSGYIHEDVTTTCYDVNSGEAGVRWAWLDSDEANVCKGYTTKYGIVVSSSSENHTLKYRFPDVMGRDMNSFKFNNAPSAFLAGQNIKFYITPMNDLNERIGNTFTATLDTNNSSETCNAHGNPVSFTSATRIEATEPQDQVPVNCAGGTWSAWGPCMMNQTDITNDQICKTGIQTRTLSGYTPATGGGTCNLEESQTCRSSGCANTTEPAQDCVLGEWDSQLASQSLNIPLYHDTFTGANTCSAACSGPAGSYPGANPGGGVRVETRDIRIEQRGQGAACGDMRRTPACNTQTCPKDCVGAWTNNGDPFEVDCYVRNAGQTSQRATYQKQDYVVSDNEVAPGTCPNRGQTRYLRTNTTRKYC